MKEMLNLRKGIKKNKPTFIRQNAPYLKRLDIKWRNPRGIHSKLRRKLRGKRKRPSVGYSSPKSVRGLHPSGLKPIIIHNLNELSNVKKENCIILSKTIGLRKKIDIAKRIKEMKLPVINLKVDQFLKESEERIGKKKVEAEKKRKEKEKAKEELLKKAEEKEKEKTETKEKETLEKVMEKEEEPSKEKKETETRKEK